MNGLIKNFCYSFSAQYYSDLYLENFSVDHKVVFSSTSVILTFIVYIKVYLNNYLELFSLWNNNCDSVE
jgi:hypothetical protein